MASPDSVPINFMRLYGPFQRGTLCCLQNVLSIPKNRSINKSTKKTIPRAKILDHRKSTFVVKTTLKLKYLNPIIWRVWKPDVWIRFRNLISFLFFISVLDYASSRVFWYHLQNRWDLFGMSVVKYTILWIWNRNLTFDMCHIFANSYFSIFQSLFYSYHFSIETKTVRYSLPRCIQKQKRRNFQFITNKSTSFKPIFSILLERLSLLTFLSSA